MKHYLTKILDNPMIEDPVKGAPDVHKHFTRYSKGQFSGPVVKFSQTKDKITIWCSHEYEDAVLRIAVDLIPDEILNVTGAVLGGMDFTPLIKDIGLGKEFYPVKSKGKTVNYTSAIKSEVSVDKKLLQTLSVRGTPYIYSLLNFTSEDQKISLKIKKKPPRPNSKNPEDSAIGGKLKFCILKIPKTPETLKTIIDTFAKDFVDEIPIKWKSITIQNTYEISSLIFPEKREGLSSRKYRLNTLREGTLKRVATIDSTDYNNSIKFIV
ncbi:MAG: hypothetical protein ACTSRX_04995 [Promethearchaeota archaeon]